MILPKLRYALENHNGSLEVVDTDISVYDERRQLFLHHEAERVRDPIEHEHYYLFRVTELEN